MSQANNINSTIIVLYLVYVVISILVGFAKKDNEESLVEILGVLVIIGVLVIFATIFVTIFFQ
jgi:hypothetical protein